MGRFGQRQGFLVSATIHLAFVLALLAGPGERRRSTLDDTSAEKFETVYLPSAADLRRLSVQRPPPAATPIPARPEPPAPPPPSNAAVPDETPPEQKRLGDRVSLGNPAMPSPRRTIIYRDDDLESGPKGRRDGSADPRPGAAAGTAQEQAPSASEPRADAKIASATTPPRPETKLPEGASSTGPQGPPADGKAARDERLARSGLRLPPGIRGSLPRARDGAAASGSPAPGAPPQTFEERKPLIMSSVPLGLPSGNGRQLGAFYYDPEGADFSVWMNHGKNEIYRNWVVPLVAEIGAGGEVVIEFTVERDGRMSSLRLLQSSGNPGLDRSARNALTGARWLPLPDDFRPERLRLILTFLFGSPRQNL